MKKKMMLLALMAGIFFLAADAQRMLSEGTISYGITVESTKGDPGMLNGLKGATLTVFLKPNISKTEMVSTLGTETTVYDNRQGKGFILKEYSGQKLMITATRENWLQKNQWNDNMKFTIDEGTTMISGYTCKKAVGTAGDGKTFTVYFTPDITLANKMYNNSFAQLPGLPVQYELQSGNITFKYTLQSISFDPLASVKFEAPKSGFRSMTYDENQQMKKAEK
jgi:GLPGLI family protein